MSSKNPNVTMWTWKVNAKGDVKKIEDLTDEEREQVHEILRRERLPYSSSLSRSPAGLLDLVERLTSQEIAMELSAHETVQSAFANAHRYLEERLMHARREREVLERDLALAEKKLTAATLDNVQLQKALDEWKTLYAELNTHHEQHHASKNPCGEQANAPTGAPANAQPSNPPAVADALPKPTIPKPRKSGGKARKAYSED